VIDIARDKIECSICGKKHNRITCNCCWISCSCGNKICGNCGSTNIVDINKSELDLSSGSDDLYWCCLECEDCGLQGCGLCV